MFRITEIVSLYIFLIIICKYRSKRKENKFAILTYLFSSLATEYIIKAKYFVFVVPR